VVALSGYVFFGSAVQLGERISALAAALDASTEAATRQVENLGVGAPVKNASDSSSALTGALRNMKPNAQQKGPVDNQPSTVSTHDDAAARSFQQRLARTGLSWEAVPAALRGAQRFLLVDFSTTSGLDATAAATFKKMSMSCALKGVVMVRTEHIRC
jgi:hypothetical protein